MTNHKRKSRHLKVVVQEAYEAGLDIREPTNYLNYKGDVRKGIIEREATGFPFGPTTIGEPVWPVTVEYDEQADLTRVGISYIPPIQPVVGALPENRRDLS